YTLNGASVSPSVNINVIIPTLTTFNGHGVPNQLNRNLGCSGRDGVTISLGCYQPDGQTKTGITWTATAQIEAGTYLSDPAESGVKFVQAVDAFTRRLWKGNRDCSTHRLNQGTEGWQLDTFDPYSEASVRYFWQGNTLILDDIDSPARTIENPDD